MIRSLNGCMNSQLNSMHDVMPVVISQMNSTECAEDGILSCEILEAVCSLGVNATCIYVDCSFPTNLKFLVCHDEELKVHEQYLSTNNSRGDVSWPVFSTVF